MKKKHKITFKKVLLVLLLPIVSVPFSLLTSMMPASAAGGTYSSMNIDDQIKAYELYRAITAGCTIAPVVTYDSDVYGSIMSNTAGSLGTAIYLYEYSSSVSSAKSGGTAGFNCNDSATVKSALNSIGVDTTSGVNTLCALGYQQTTRVNTSVNPQCGASGIKTGSSNIYTYPGSSVQGVPQTAWVKSVLKATTSVFGGVAPTWTDAMTYRSTWNDFIQGCGSGSNIAENVTGSSTNPNGEVVNGIPYVDEGTGAVTTASYSIQNNQQPAEAAKDLAISSQSGNDNPLSCDGLAAVLKETATGQKYNKYLVAYQQYIYSTQGQCPKTYSDSTQISACVSGQNTNPSNIAYCTKTYTSSTTVSGAGRVSTVDNTALRDACYTGQNYPGGTKCYIQYTDLASFTACVNGRANSTDPNYCSSVDGQGKPIYQPATLVAACVKGQGLGTAPGLATPNVDCNKSPKPSTCPDTTTPSNATSCVVDGIGWLVCPLMNAIGGLNDAMYGWIQSVLVLNPLSQTMTDSNGATVTSPQYANWANIRNIANVLLVIGFLAIIFSQITSIGISNYGVKKMLPRIVLVALGINLSWVIMSLSIDVVNIVGVGLHTLLNSSAVGADSSTLSYASTVSDLVSGTGIAAVLAAGGVFAAIASSSVLTTLVLIALPFLLGAVLALFAAVATLFLRNALVIVLVIIAPVAIAASILPNTEEYFKKWRKLFLSMLFLFPMAALLFAGAKFAAYVMLTSNQPLAQIVALFIMAAPLGMLPWLLRSSGGILSTVNGRLGSMAKSIQGAAQKGLAPRIQTSRDERKDNSRDIFGRRRNGRIKGGHEETHQEEIEEPILFKSGPNKGKQRYSPDGTPMMRKTGEFRDVTTTVGGTPRRRNLSQMLAQSGERLKTRSETAKKNLASDSEELGLDRPGRPGKAKVAAIYDQSRQAGLRSESIGAEYKGRLEVSKLVDGDTRAIYDRLQDAGTTTKALEEEQALRQKTRIQNKAVNTAAEGIGISRLANIGATRDAYTSDATVARLKNVGTKSLEGGSTLEIFHENTEAAEQGVKTIDAKFSEDLAKRKELGGDLFLSAAAEATSKNVEAASQEALKTKIKEFATDQTAEEIRELVGPEPVKADFGGDSRAYTDAVNLRTTKLQQLAATEAPSQPGGQTLRNKLQEAAATTKVEGIAGQQAEGVTSLGIDAKMMGDTTEGRELLRRATGVGNRLTVQAVAGQRLQQDQENDTKAYRADMQRNHLTAGQVFDQVLHTDPSLDTVSIRPLGEIPLPQEVAAIQQAVEEGGLPDNMNLLNYSAEVSRQAALAEREAQFAERADPGSDATLKKRKDATDAKERALSISGALQGAWRANPSRKPAQVGGSIEEKIASGNETRRQDIIVADRITNGKVPPTLGSMSIDHIKNYAELMESWNADPAKREKDIRESIRPYVEARIDPASYTNEASWEAAVDTALAREDLTDANDNLSQYLLVLDEALYSPKSGLPSLTTEQRQTMEDMRTAVYSILSTQPGLSLPEVPVFDATTGRTGALGPYHKRESYEYPT